MLPPARQLRGRPWPGPRRQLRRQGYSSRNEWENRHHVECLVQSIGNPILRPTKSAITPLVLYDRRPPNTTALGYSVGPRASQAIARARFAGQRFRAASMDGQALALPDAGFDCAARLLGRLGVAGLPVPERSRPAGHRARARARRVAVRVRGTRSPREVDGRIIGAGNPDEDGVQGTRRRAPRWSIVRLQPHAESACDDRA